MHSGFLTTTRGWVVDEPWAVNVAGNARKCLTKISI